MEEEPSDGSTNFSEKNIWFYFILWFYAGKYFIVIISHKTILSY